MVDQNQKEICKYMLKQEAGAFTAMVFCKLYRIGNGWKFSAIGEGVTYANVDKPSVLKRYASKSKRVTLTGINYSSQHNFFQCRKHEMLQPRI
jgi:hypothetical protein